MSPRPRKKKKAKRRAAPRAEADDAAEEPELAEAEVAPPEPAEAQPAEAQPAEAQPAGAEPEEGEPAEAGADAKGDAPEPLPGLGTRDGAKLREAHVAFEAGDYVAVRERAKALEAKAEDPAVREAAAALRARVEVDPIQIVVLLACAAAVVAIVFQWIL